jgi:hypothetical protein
VLANNTILHNLNLSFNNFSQCLKVEKEGELPEVIQNMKSFFEGNKLLLHLDLTGCGLGNAILEITDLLYMSCSLIAVHLSNNDLSEETKELVKQSFRIKS